MVNQHLVDCIDTTVVVPCAAVLVRNENSFVLVIKVQMPLKNELANLSLAVPN